ncbi:hypothetical protein B7T07_23115 [Cronobacter sakazakii]|uniref:Uncharacterized protein n=1 Tax=Cronobacter sakazakii TaxID=28141 RepID=A0AA44Z5I5_CROSK|nr:hypothetical protein B7T07_23115 [Cronobacter sakazakii]
MLNTEDLQKAFEQFQESCKVIVKFICQVWEQIKEITEKYKMYCKPRSMYGYVKHRAMKSQVLNRKPTLIRARTTC